MSSGCVRGWQRGLVGVLALMVVWMGTGCAMVDLFRKTDWLEAEGRAVKVTWEKPLNARLKARQEATDQARTILLEKLLDSRVDLAQGTWASDDTPLSGNVVRLVNLTEVDPAFSAQLHALVGELQPVSVSDEAEGELLVKMRLNRDQALELVRSARTRLSDPQGR
ncbi:MAG TPA: hypothetical protein PLA90_17625 [Candidatus Sumerlaeota bacterium]|nr:hypothetical protein [Candidatus Sumerlaeota bacterium]HPS03363.1 hypothetical protein [Candidatus Sumerlaeota bacterium]